MTIDEINGQIFIDSEEVCGNTMIDTYLAQEYVEQAYNKAIDDFVEKLSLAFDETIEEYGFYPENLIRQVAERLKVGDTK